MFKPPQPQSSARETTILRNILTALRPLFFVCVPLALLTRLRYGKVTKMTHVYSFITCWQLAFLMSMLHLGIRGEHSELLRE